MRVLAASDLADGATVVAAVVALLGILGPLRGWFKRTLGRRLDLYRRFDRLGVGAHEDFFKTVIGEGPAIRRKVPIYLPDYEALEAAGDWSVSDADPPQVERAFTESLWVDPLFYVQTLSDEDGTVLGFSVTTRVKRFAPRFAAPRPVARWRWQTARLTKGKVPVPALAHAELGRSRFIDVVTDGYGVPKVRCNVGARTFAYSEAWSFGNPGHYSEYVCSTNMASEAAPWPEVELNNLDWPDERADPDDGWGPDLNGERTLAPWIERVRSTVKVTTWSVIKFPLSAETWPASFGPHGDEVRTLP